MAQVTNIGQVDAQDEARLRAEMGEDYAPPDEAQPLGADDIGFNFLDYPTLHEMALDDARVKITIGPAGCLSADTYVMTEEGWRSIKSAPKRIKVYDKETDNTYFDDVEFVKYPCDKFYRFRVNKILDMVVSEEHRIWYKYGDEEEWSVDNAEDFANRVMSDNPKAKYRFLIADLATGDAYFWAVCLAREFAISAYDSPDGYKYCFHTKTGMFVAMRQGAMPFVTGNSAKTSGIIWTMFAMALQQEPAQDGVRYSKALVVRNTNTMLRSTTIPSFRSMLGNLMTFRLGSYPMMGHIRADLSDGTKIHFDVEFMSFDDERSQNKLLGCEPTFAFLDEISELPESLLFAVDRRLGRYPNGRFGKATWVGLFAATNGPLKNHWLYQWYLGKKDDEFAMMSRRMKRPYFKLFRQPPALLRQSDGEWLPNPEAENIDNLPDKYNYYYAMLGGDDQKIKAYVEGEFADLVTGKVVFPEFNESRHVIPQFKLPPMAPLKLSFDFGRTPVCLVATTTAGGRLIVIDEIMGEDMSIDTLIVEHVKPVLKQRYPHNLVESATADPAGLVEAQSVDLSPYDVLLKHGIPVESPGTNKLQPRLESVKQLLTKLDRSGEPMLQITENCKFLIEALKYNYIYEQVRGRNDMVRDTPTKSHEGWCSDLSDSLGYLSLHHNLVTRVYTSNARSRKTRARFI